MAKNPLQSNDLGMCVGTDPGRKHQKDRVFEYISKDSEQSGSSIHQ